MVCSITVAKKEPTLKMILPNLSKYSDRADNDPPVPKRGVSVMQEECIRKRGLTSHQLHKSCPFLLWEILSLLWEAILAVG